MCSLTLNALCQFVGTNDYHTLEKLLPKAEAVIQNRVCIDFQKETKPIPVRQAIALLVKDAYHNKKEPSLERTSLIVSALIGPWELKL